MSRFEVGQRVVCVNDDPNAFDRDEGEFSGVRRGCVYTIREVNVRAWGRPKDRNRNVRLVGVVRPSDDPRWHDYPYHEDRFEPLPKKTTSIEVFQKMLNPVPEKVEP